MMPPPGSADRIAEMRRAVELPPAHWSYWLVLSTSKRETLSRLWENVSWAADEIERLTKEGEDLKASSEEAVRRYSRVRSRVFGST